MIIHFTLWIWNFGKCQLHLDMPKLWSAQFFFYSYFDTQCNFEQSNRFDPFLCRKTWVKPLNCQSQLLSSALSSACDFKSHFCKQCGPRSDCSFRSSLIRVHTVRLYAKIGLKCLQEYSADDINRRHFQMQFFLALEGLTNHLPLKDWYC